jgi:hypothetical protein
MYSTKPIHALIIKSVDQIELESTHEQQQHLGFATRKNREPFPARKLTVEKTKLRNWDLCAFFFNSEVSTAKKGSKDERQPKIEILECTHFTLDFKNTEERKKFELALLEVKTTRLRQLEDADYARGLAEAEAQARQAQHSDKHVRGDSAYGARSTSASRVSVVPKLPPIAQLPTISFDSASMMSGRRDSKKARYG